MISIVSLPTICLVANHAGRIVMTNPGGSRPSCFIDVSRSELLFATQDLAEQCGFEMWTPIDPKSYQDDVSSCRNSGGSSNNNFPTPLNTRLKSASKSQKP